MRQIMDRLLVLQTLQLQARKLSSEDEGRVQELRAQVPAPVLGHFDRLLVRGKRGVAIARNGVCNECHLRITSGTLATLAYTNDVHLCDNCGRYLYLPENELPGLAGSTSPQAPVEPSRGRGRRKAGLHVG